MTMGFREPSTIKLEFEEGDPLHGLEVRMRGMSIAEWMQASGQDGEGDDGAATIRRFYKALISWNLEDPDTGEPVPVDDAPNRDSRMIRRLNNAWIEGVMGVHKADPLPDASPSGETYPELSAVPTEPLSQSQAS